MVGLRTLERTAVFAWSPGAESPLLVTGTKQGALSDDFSGETKLELWDLELGNTSVGELQPVASIGVDSRCVPLETLLFHIWKIAKFHASDSMMWRGDCQRMAIRVDLLLEVWRAEH